MSTSSGTSACFNGERGLDALMQGLDEHYWATRATRIQQRVTCCMSRHVNPNLDEWDVRRWAARAEDGE